MKKRITFLMAAVVAAVFGVQAQNLLVDNFESGVNKWGAWGVDKAEIVENPNSSGINTSAHVYKLENALNSCGIYYDSGTHGDLPVVVSISGNVNSGEYRYLHFKFLRDNAASMVIKLNPLPYLTREYWVSANTEWQYIVIDLREKNTWSENELGSSYQKVDIEPNKNGSTTTLYLDDIYFSPSEEHITGDQTSVKNGAVTNSGIRLSRSADGNTVAHVGDLKGALKLEVYNIAGSLLRVVYDGTASAGAYELPSFDAGIYLLRATTSKGTYSFKF
jgi:hypothetical protein